MKHYKIKFKFFLTLSIVMLLFTGCSKSRMKEEKSGAQIINGNSQLAYLLPPPQLKGSVTVEQAIAQRRSRRHYRDKKITVEQLSQILWASYGITSRENNVISKNGLRAAPSAGALYPLEIYVLAGKVEGIEPGTYKYIPQEHKIIRSIDQDIRAKLCVTALKQKMISEAPVVLFYTAVYSRCTKKYGNRGRDRYVCMDLGHSAENVYLQVEALHLGTCAVGAFNDDEVRKVLQLNPEEEPLYFMPIGYYYKE